MIRHVETPLGHGSNAYPPKRRVRRGSDEPDAPGQEHLRGVTGEPSPMSRKDSAPARLQPLAQIEDQHSGQLLMQARSGGLASASLGGVVSRIWVSCV